MKEKKHLIQRWYEQTEKERTIRHIGMIIFYFMLISVFILFLCSKISIDTKLDCSSGKIDLKLDSNPYYTSYSQINPNEILSILDANTMLWDKDFKEINLERELLIDNLDINNIENLNCKISVKVDGPLFLLLVR
jgi:hypothetical protein